MQKGPLVLDLPSITGSNFWVIVDRGTSAHSWKAKRSSSLPYIPSPVSFDVLKFNQFCEDGKSTLYILRYPNCCTWARLLVRSRYWIRPMSTWASSVSTFTQSPAWRSNFFVFPTNISAFPKNLLQFFLVRSKFNDYSKALLLGSLYAHRALGSASCVIALRQFFLEK